MGIIKFYIILTDLNKTGNVTHFKLNNSSNFKNRIVAAYIFS